MYKKHVHYPVWNYINHILLNTIKSLFALIVLITVINDDVLLHAQVYHQNLLWYVALFSFLIAILKSNITESQEIIYSSEKIMKNIAVYTHYFPDLWKKNCHRNFVRDQFNNLYMSNLKIIWCDLLQKLSLPYTMGFVIPSRVENMLNFIKEHTVTVPEVGDICSLSHFEVRNVEVSDKLSKSFLNYEVQHPKYIKNFSVLKKIQEHNIDKEAFKDLEIGTQDNLEYYMYKMNEINSGI